MIGWFASKKTIFSCYYNSYCVHFIQLQSLMVFLPHLLAVLEEPKPYGSSCLMNVLFHGSRFCKEWECDRQKSETAVLVKFLLGIGADVDDKFSYHGR